MPKKTSAVDSLPAAVLSGLRQLGENLALARKRRKESRQAWANRIGVSEPTLRRMEAGDPGVGMGVYATALWLFSPKLRLQDLAAPEHDVSALEASVRLAKARSVRKSPPSLEARLRGAVAKPAASRKE